MGVEHPLKPSANSPAMHFGDDQFRISYDRSGHSLDKHKVLFGWGGAHVAPGAERATIATQPYHPHVFLNGPRLKSLNPSR